ncbi:MAG TPA: DoxX family protein [Bacteroidales bacterium]|nr:DoxX family protein [Bacteroidales bacterium]HPO65212.1 DoxX family protein [Bacteroidales bacterium]
MKNKILFVICLLTGLLFINSGLNKLFNYLPVPDDLPEKLKLMNAAMMQIGWLIPLVAFAEIIGGLLFIFRRTRALGAIVLFPVMLGILLTHLTAAPSGLPMAIVLLIIEGWGILENRKKYMTLLQKH